MSEQKKSFMQELDKCTFQVIVDPLLKVAQSGNTVEWHRVRDRVYRAVHGKVLESYRNGQAAGRRNPLSEAHSRASVNHQTEPRGPITSAALLYVLFISVS